MVFLQAAVVILVGLKLAYGIFVPPNGDEAYYWLWGGHLQLSYYDHAPMVGWTSAIGRAILGWTPAGLHFPAFVTFLILASVLHRAAYWLAPERPEHYFWTCLAIFCGSPLLNALTTLNYPDHLLICFGSIALLYLGKYLGSVIEGVEEPAPLYIGAGFLGLAGLSKYNAVFIAAGLLVALIAAPRLRRVFRSRHLYQAGALCLAIISPVLVWNLQNHFASAGLHAVERFDEGADLLAPLMLARVVVLSILEVSPFLMAGFALFLFGRPTDPRLTGLLLICRATAAISTLFFLPLAATGGLGKQVAPHWLVISFLPFMLVAPFYVRSRVLVGLHLAWGTSIVALAVTYYLAAPLLTGMVGMSDGEASRTFGQHQLAAAVSTAVEKYDADLVVTKSYTSASQLAFGMGSEAIVSDSGGRVDRLVGRDLGAAATGKTMILVGRVDSWLPHFDSVETIGSIETTRYDAPLRTYELSVGRGYRP